MGGGDGGDGCAARPEAEGGSEAEAQALSKTDDEDQLPWQVGVRGSTSCTPNC